MILTSLGKFRDLGLLILRVGLGVMMIKFGMPKIMAGPAKWAELGQTMHLFGISFFPVFWGFMCAIAETLGGALMVIGFLFRPATILLTINMVVAAVAVYSRSRGDFMMWSRPAELALVFASLILIGAGKYSVDR